MFVPWGLSGPHPPPLLSYTLQFYFFFLEICLPLYVQIIIHLRTSLDNTGRLLRCV